MSSGASSLAAQSSRMGWRPAEELLETRYHLPVVVEHRWDRRRPHRRLHRGGAGRRSLDLLDDGRRTRSGDDPQRAAVSGCERGGRLGRACAHGRDPGPVAWGKAGRGKRSPRAPVSPRLPVEVSRQLSQEITAKEVAERAAQGDPLAQDVLDTAAEYLGRGITMLVDILNPEMIVLGSLAARLGDRLLSPAMQIVEQVPEPSALAVVCYCPSALGERLGDLAPAAAVLHEFEQGFEFGASSCSPGKMKYT